MKFILGKKLGMTQVWQGEEKKAVTKIAAGPCIVTQVKTDDNDGYQALQVGFGEKKAKNIRKPQKGHLKNLENFRYLKEFRLDKENSAEVKRGDKIDLQSFAAGEGVKITGISKGRGFQGVVKRHGFGGQLKTHGTKDQLRMPGSIGATGPAHVFKGMRMPGRMGGDRVSVANMEIVDIDFENNIIYVEGGVPGAKNGLLLISAPGELKIAETKKDDSVSPEATQNKDKVNTEKAESSDKEAEESKAEIKKDDSASPEATQNKDKVNTEKAESSDKEAEEKVSENTDTKKESK